MPHAAATLPHFLRPHFDPEALLRDSATLIVVDPRGVMLWRNNAWDRFARENGSPALPERFPIGTSYYGGITGVLRRFYESMFEDAYAKNKVFEQEYECSSDNVFRLMHLRAIPIPEYGLLLQHSEVVHKRRGEDPYERLTRDYVADNGILVQCSNCRRVRKADGSAWHWVPSWVSSAHELTSHGLCNVCVGLFLGGLQ